jgi:hypothetical protein
MKFKKIRKLRIFDFDDTLIWTDAKIRITNKNLELSTLEFGKYKQENDDIYDFTDFRTGKLMNPKPTAFFRSAFMKIIQGDSDIMILTARPNTEEISDFLDSYNIPSDRLTIVGGAKTPELKKREIEKILNKYDNIKFYDDSISNIAAVNSLKSPKITTQIVKK